MKKIIKWIKKYIGETLLIIGSYIVAYNLFNFSFARYNKYYYYEDNVQTMIAIGVSLVVIGILIIRIKKK